jgi:hypothetical protein
VKPTLLNGSAEQIEWLGPKELWNIFHHKYACPGHVEHTRVLAPQLVTRIARITISKLAEALAWRATNHYVNLRPFVNVLNIRDVDLIINIQPVCSRRFAIPFDRAPRD